MSVGWDVYNQISMYSSNRVPISLAAGVPHITNYQPGYENAYYSKVPGLFIAKTPRDMADIVMFLMSMPVDERIDLGVRAAEYAHEHLNSITMHSRMIELIKEQLMT